MSDQQAEKAQLLQKVRESVQNYCDKFHDFSFDPKKPRVKLHESTFSAPEINAALEKMLAIEITMGKTNRAFEEQYAKMYGHQYGVSCNSGSSANLLAIAALANPFTKDRLHPGDEVIVPALSWSTTVWPIIQNNMVPVFVDCDPKTLNFDMNKLEAAIGPKTRAIMLVHVYGNPCDMDALMSIANKHNLIVIEDCCEAMGAYFDGKAVGSFGRVGTLSFFYCHHITTLEGGICVTDDFELTETMRVLRAHGWSREADEHQKYIKQYPDIDPRFIFINVGYNFRITEVQAAMGIQQLTKLDNFVNERRAIAAFYKQHLAKYSDYLDFQVETPKGRHSWFGFCITLKPNTPFTLQEITSFLQARHIETRPIIAGNIAKHPGTQLFTHRIGGDLSAATNVMQHGFAIGNHQGVDQNARHYVVDMFAAFFAQVNNKSSRKKTAIPSHPQGLF